MSVLIDEGPQVCHSFSPEQAEKGPAPLDGGDWTDVSNNRVDPGMAYRYFHRDGSKRFIDVFFYDMGIARGIAFEGALISSQAVS